MSIVFTYDDVINMQVFIGKGFGYRERSLFMGVNYCFGPRRTNIPHATPNYWPGQSKL